ncbi:alpha/beta hydrolase [Flagellimonas sp. DF-77]|uniref:alpha/beta fold hydrolase n=1 Tax=Flagellimonas algarum TaxID=3230298 RepID=UPI003391B443
MTIEAYAQTPNRTESVAVNGKTLYYESYGEGPPLLLLHGYSQSSISWRPYVKEFTEDFEVFLIDLTGHGKSAPFDSDLSVRSVGEDLLALIRHLNLTRVDAVGFSFGGDILYQVALIDPNCIRSMITIGAVGTWTIADFPEYLEEFTFENRANFPWLERSHANETTLKALLDQFKNYRVRLSDEELQAITPEVMIMVGDDDEGTPMEEVFRARTHLPHSDLWILPDVAHSAHAEPNKTVFLNRAKAFFSKKK